MNTIQRLTQFATNVVAEFFTDALFPTQCIGCTKIGASICGACFEHALQVEYVQGDSISVFTMGAYTTPLLQNAVKQLKFHNQRALGTQLGFALAACIANQRVIETCGIAPGQKLVAPIPLHSKRLKERGYNQAAEIAAPVAELLHLEYLPHALARAVSTGRHSDMKHDQRWAHIAGAFSVNPEHAQLIQGKHILLIDDVITTGATATEAAQELLGAGAEHITICAVARGG